MDIAIKLTLVASLLFMGYSLLELISSYESIKKKSDEFVELFKESEIPSAKFRRSNFITTFVLMGIYLALIWNCGLVLWIPALVTLKIAITMFVSDRYILQMLAPNGVSVTFFRLNKLDALANILVSLGIALILVL